MTRTTKMLELRKKGLTVKEITIEMQISRNYVSTTLARLRRQGDLERVPKEEAIRRQKQSVQSKHTAPEIIIDLSKKGLSATKIAEKLNESKQYVRKIVGSIRAKKAEEFRKKVLEIYPTGMSYEEMSKVLMTSIGHIAVTVNRLVKKGLLKNRK